MPHPLGYQLAHGAPAAGRLDFEAPVQGIVEINGGFHESKLPILLGNVNWGAAPPDLAHPPWRLRKNSPFRARRTPDDSRKQHPTLTDENSTG